MRKDPNDRNATANKGLRKDIVKITAKGQVTIPIGIRRRMGLLPHTDVDFLISGGDVLLRKTTRSRRRGTALVAALRGKAPKGGMTTDEIMALTRGISLP